MKRFVSGSILVRSFLTGQSVRGRFRSTRLNILQSSMVTRYANRQKFVNIKGKESGTVLRGSMCQFLI